MPDPTRIDQVVEEYLDRLDRGWSRAVADLAEGHRRALGPIRRTIEALERDIALAIAQEVEVSASWLYQRDRYRILERQVRAEIAGTALRVAEVVPALREQGIDTGIEYADDVVRVANPQYAGIEARLPREAIRAQVGFLQSPGLQAVGQSIDPDRGWLMLRDRLVSGIASGENVRSVARAMTRSIDGLTLTRAMTITRTEMLRSYRQAASQRWRELQAVTEWVWRAAIFDGRRPPCPVCMGLHGERFPVDQFMASHPNCRCVMVPTTIYTVVDRNLLPGAAEEQLRSLPERTQRQVLGRSRWNAWSQGELDLRNMVEWRTDPLWGTQPRLTRLRDLGLLPVGGLGVTR